LTSLNLGNTVLNIDSCLLLAARFPGLRELVLRVSLLLSSCNTVENAVEAFLVGLPGLVALVVSVVPPAASNIPVRIKPVERPGLKAFEVVGLFVLTAVSCGFLKHTHTQVPPPFIMLL
jgi:hypothetical protein